MGLRLDNTLTQEVAVGMLSEYREMVFRPKGEDKPKGGQQEGECHQEGEGH